MLFKLFESKLRVYAKAFRSQPAPEDNTGPVKIAVGSTFDQVVTNSGRDALILFYKPTCPYCIRLEPTWIALGEAMKNEAIDIVKIDAIANDWPGPYVVDQYPTIYLKFADNNKRPLEYSSNSRSLQRFIRYIAYNATNELLGWDRKGKPKTTSWFFN